VIGRLDRENIGVGRPIHLLAWYRVPALGFGL